MPKFRTGRRAPPEYRQIEESEIFEGQRVRFLLRGESRFRHTSWFDQAPLMIAGNWVEMRLGRTAEIIAVHADWSIPDRVRHAR